MYLDTNNPKTRSLYSTIHHRFLFSSLNTKQKHYDFFRSIVFSQTRELTCLFSYGFNMGVILEKKKKSKTIDTFKPKCTVCGSWLWKVHRNMTYPAFI